MSIDSTWLRCPNCFHDLSAITDRVLGCELGHRFDLAKHGSVTLLPPRAPRTIGDDRRMLEARAGLLDSGAYAPIAEALVDVAREAAREAHRPPVASADGEGASLRIIDLGCGTGYYARALQQAIPRASVLLSDRSPNAVRMALRAVPDATGVVLDLWRPLPIRDAVVDVAINVFAPRNAAEFARITRPGGTLLVVVPTAAHFIELRRLGAALDIPDGKAAQVSAQFAEVGFAPLQTRRIEYSLATDVATRDLLVDMGPAARHHRDAGDAAGAGELAVTVSIDVVAFTRGEHAPS